MAVWSDDDIIRLNLKFAQQGIARHARALAAAMELLGSEFVMGANSDPQWRRVCDDYDRLFPDAAMSWPGMAVGLIANIDQVKAVTVPVIVGQMRLSAAKILGFQSDNDLFEWCHRDQPTFLRSSLAAADLMDFAYGLDENRGIDRAFELLTLASSQLADTSAVLVAGSSVKTVVQPICLIVELSFKGALLRLGLTEEEIVSLGHKHVRMARKLASMKPHRDDAIVAKIVAKLPSYSRSRYADTELNRLECVQLALGAQFIAASSVRRISSRDIAASMETRVDPIKRLETYYVG